MGISFSCPSDALDDSMEALFVRSVSFNDSGVKTTMHSVSFNGRESEPTLLKAFGSGKMIIKGSLSFKERELETTFTIKSPKSETEDSLDAISFKSTELLSQSSDNELESPKHEAAVKLQKVYKSFRTRRQLADCAVLVEQRWWKLLDFALLRRSSVSFFEIEKPESVVSRWSRARTRAAKVGKGLSKDEKAQKLALQHWLEAIDPRHRYGHNLHFYYICWLHCDSRQPFFYWLDVGEGKEVSVERCPRTKLQQQSIKYLGPKEREAYEVIVEDGRFVYKQNQNLLDTSEGPEGSKWIFVLSTSKNLYVGQKKKGTFQHSSFLAGGATSAAGRLVVENGVLKAVWPHSGHYRPTEENFQEFVSFLIENNVDLTDVKKAPTEEDDESQSILRKNSILRSNSSKLDLMIEMSSATKQSVSGEGTNGDKSYILSPKRDDSCETSKHTGINSSCDESQLDGETAEESSSSDLLNMSGASILIGECEGDSKDDANEKARISESSCSSSSAESKSESSVAESELNSPRPDYSFHKKNLFEEDHDENEEPVIPQELILHRINSKKGMNSYQLGRQLSCKWTTGAGPRIGCIRDYPSELQFCALEQVNLSPRSAESPKASSFFRNPTGGSPRPLTASSMK